MDPELREFLRRIVLELEAIRRHLDRLYDLLYEHCNPGEVEDLGVIEEEDGLGRKPQRPSPLRGVSSEGR